MLRCFLSYSSLWCLTRPRWCGTSFANRLNPYACPLLLLFFVLCSTAAALRPDDDFSKLRVKQLRELLLAHGEACEGCVEKRDFEQKLREAVVAAQQAR